MYVRVVSRTGPDRIGRPLSKNDKYSHNSMLMKTDRHSDREKDREEKMRSEI